MKISDLKQPYRRMAEYLAEENTSQHYNDKTILNRAFKWSFDWKDISRLFWKEVDKGNHPEITEEIKEHFPPDFDFSEEEVKNKPVMQMLDTETQKTIYTQLAKEGKFDELPNTCEFSEAVELLVWDNVEPIKMNDSDLRLVSGKFRGVFIAQNSHASNKYVIWQYAKLPTPKIDFSEFKSGDVVEVELSNEEKRIGWFDYTDRNQVVIKTLQRKGNQVCNGGNCAGSKIINKEKIKSIIKIK